jgi:hypothetical protein
MGLSQTVQDGLLGWLRGRAMPVPPTMLYLSFHSSRPPGGSSEVSAQLGGRVPLMGATDLSEPRRGASGLREIVNTKALISGVAEQRLVIESIGLWTDSTGGQLVLGASVEPALVVEKGDPAAFFSGQLILRATASV